MTSAGQYKLVKVKNRSQDPRPDPNHDIREVAEESKANGQDDSYLMNIDWKNAN